MKIVNPHHNITVQILKKSQSELIEFSCGFQSKIYWVILNTALYITNSFIRNDFGLKTVKEDVNVIAKIFKIKLSNHPNNSVVAVLAQKSDLPRIKRTKRTRLTCAYCTFNNWNIFYLWLRVRVSELFLFHTKVLINNRSDCTFLLLLIILKKFL